LFCTWVVQADTHIASNNREFLIRSIDFLHTGFCPDVVMRLGKLRPCRVEVGCDARCRAV
jgi:hypothetical protein